MENHQTEANRNSDTKKKTEFDWTHITQRIRRIEKIALVWNPQGYRRRGRPKRKWRRTMEKEIRSIGRSWNELEIAMSGSSS